MINKYITIIEDPTLTEFNTSYGPCQMRCIADIKMASALEDKQLIEVMDIWDNIRSEILGSFKTIEYKSIQIYPDGIPNNKFKDFKVYIGVDTDQPIKQKYSLCWTNKQFIKLMSKKLFIYK